MDRPDPAPTRPQGRGAHEHATRVRVEYDRLARLAAEGAVRPVALGLAALYLAFVPAHLLLADARVARVMAPVALASAIVYALVALRSDRAPLADRGHGVLAGMAGVALLNSALHEALAADPVLTTNLGLVVLGSGALLFRQKYLTAVIGLGVASFLAIGALDGFADPLWVHFGIGLACAIVLAQIFYHARNRFIHRVAVLEVAGRAREHRLTDSERRYRHLFEAGPAMICVHDLDGRILDSNPSGAETLGIPRERLLGAHISDFLVNREDGVHLDYLADLVRDGEAVGTAAVLLPDGRERIWRYESRLFSDPEVGRYAIASAQDISELEEARTRLEAHRAELESAVRQQTLELKRTVEHLEVELAERARMESRLIEQHKLEGLGRLAGGVAHEFNNILAIIRGYTDLVSDTVPEGTTAAGYLDDVQDAVGRGAALVRKILEFSDPGRGPHESFDLGALIRETVSLLRPTMPVGVELDLAVDDDVHTVMGDRRQLRQVIVDLVENARAAVAPGSGRVHVLASVRRVDGRRWMRIEVVDDGSGISPEDLPRVFEPFFTTREVGAGQGLGLSVANSVVRGHGGHIRLECPPSGGTRATVEIPARSTRALESPSGIEADRAARWPDGIQVLVVDDEPAIRMVVRRTLEGAGHRVFEAGDAFAALAEFDRRGADIELVVTDLSMPGMGGGALVSRLRAHAPGLPVLVITGFGMKPNLDSLSAQGPTQLLVKPFRAMDLARAVERLVAHARGRDEE